LVEAKLNLAILISGRGSNMQALVRACEKKDFPAEVSVIISNNPKSEGAKWAKEKGLNVEIIDHTNFSSKTLFEDKIDNTLAAYNIDIICLAGFMRVLSEAFINGWKNKIINIHPSLLPKYKGLDTHKRVLLDKEEETGCTVHYVRAEVDAGPIILQEKVPVLHEDTVESLSKRVLEKEHIIYPKAIELLGKGKIKLGNDKVEII
jgi:phosphoribosylglycinamide formyltransferase-1